MAKFSDFTHVAGNVPTVYLVTVWLPWNAEYNDNHSSLTLFKDWLFELFLLRISSTR